MWRYRWPGHETLLLTELQRQQRMDELCDTLLHSEGIYVPTHSCILAALSPYLSQQLLASPSPLLGHKRTVQLHTISAQTMLKLVGLMYSGEMDLTGTAEQSEVLSAARQFGITDLVEGCNDGVPKEGEPRKNFLSGVKESQVRSEGRNMQDKEVQVEMDGWGAKASSGETGTCASSVIIAAGESTVSAGGSLPHSFLTNSPTKEPASSAAQNLNFSSPMQSQDSTHDDDLCSTLSPPVTSGSVSQVESMLDQSSGSVSNTLSSTSLPRNVMPIFTSHDDSNSQMPPEDGTHQQPSERQADGKTVDDGEYVEQPSLPDGNDLLEKDKGSSLENTQEETNVGVKCLTKIKQKMQMMSTTQISIKVKLRRKRTRGGVWEVVSMQEKDGETEKLSVLSSREKDCSHHKKPQEDLTNSETDSSPVQPSQIHQPEALGLQPAATNSPEPPPPNFYTFCNSEVLSGNCFSLNQSNGLQSASPGPEPPSFVCDEQIEKLLEDIMMGLNFLPDLERDCKKSCHIEQSRDQTPTICPVQVKEKEGAQSQTDASISTSGAVYLQDFATQIQSSTIDTGDHCFPGIDQPSSSSLPSVHQEGKQSPPHCHLSAEKRVENGDKGIPLRNGNEAQSPHFSLCLDDFRLPVCLSPLQLSPSEDNRSCNCSSSNCSDETLQRPTLLGRPWLVENPESLQFPLSAITNTTRQSASLPEEGKKHSCSSKLQDKKQVVLSPPNGRIQTGSPCIVKETETTPASCKKKPEAIFDPKNIQKSDTCKQDKPMSGDAAEPKRRGRKRKSNSQDVTSTVSVAVESQIKLGICSVSMSSNNVLIKERQMSSRLSNTTNKIATKSNDPLTFIESGRERIRRPRFPNTPQPQIRTRSSLNKSEDTQSNASLETPPAVKPIPCSPEIVNEQGFSKRLRKRNRPLEPKSGERPPEFCPSITEKIIQRVDQEEQPASSLLNLDKLKIKIRRNKKNRRKNTDVDSAPLAETVSVKSTGKPKADHNDVVISAGEKPKWPRRVGPKGCQKLINHGHSKTRKSKERQGKQTDETAGAVEIEGKTYESEDLIKHPGMDITLSRNRDRKESCDSVNVTVDINHNETLHQPEAEHNRSKQHDPNKNDISSPSNENTTAFSPAALGEAVSKLSTEREQKASDPDEAEKPCDVRLSGATQQTAISDEGSCHSDNPLPQVGNLPMVHGLNLQTPQRTGPPVVDTVGLIRDSSCDEGGVEEEEEEEEEVDVLCCSPEEVPQIRECENGLLNLEISEEEEKEEEEEEEEEMNDIDVTGDDTE